MGLSHWDPYAVCRCGCLELYYCNMVEWFWWDSSLILTTNWFPSVLWHCWFAHLACKNRPRNDYNVLSATLSLYIITGPSGCLVFLLHACVSSRLAEQVAVTKSFIVVRLCRHSVTVILMFPLFYYQCCLYDDWVLYMTGARLAVRSALPSLHRSSTLTLMMKTMVIVCHEVTMFVLLLCRLMSRKIFEITCSSSWQFQSLNCNYQLHISAYL